MTSIIDIFAQELMYEKRASGLSPVICIAGIDYYEELKSYCLAMYPVYVSEDKDETKPIRVRGIDVYKGYGFHAGFIFGCL